MTERDVTAEWLTEPRYVADRGRDAQAAPTLRCHGCAQTAHELFHGFCMPCAIAHSVPLRQRDRDAYQALRNAVGTPPAPVPILPAAPPLPWWHWRRWVPGAARRAGDRARTLVAGERAPSEGGTGAP